MTWVVRKETFIETSQCIRLFSNMLETEKLFFSYGAVEVKKKKTSQICLFVLRMYFLSAKSLFIIGV